MRRARDRARRAAQTAEERDARLRQIRENRCQSLATESEEERAVRLQQMSANQCHRLATETEEERAARSSHPSIQLSIPSIHPCRPVPVAVLKIISSFHPAVHPTLHAILISTMLHTYFLLGMIVHVCTHRSRPHPCTQSRKTG